ncbi:hypothetical protein LSH36_1007g01007 [Paralvinella palmiformis]|uniref:Uncharacterized protein n=1 Tax=Paralvinella palmiformis TaxID=53620 RepID=A0AAD9MQS1_9ANNE|nr:hypothetical protein LSH36_1007g01007 [Paralvinella palmiformis]
MVIRDTRLLGEDAISDDASSNGGSSSPFALLILDDPHFALIIPHLTGLPLVSVPKSSYILLKSNTNLKEGKNAGVLLVHVVKTSNYTSVWNIYLERRNYGCENTEGQQRDTVPVGLCSTSDVTTQLLPEWRLQRTVV